MQTKRAYGKLIDSICRRLLQNDEDARECAGEVYLAGWQRIPPIPPFES